MSSRSVARAPLLTVTVACAFALPAVTGCGTATVAPLGRPSTAVGQDRSQLLAAGVGFDPVSHQVIAFGSSVTSTQGPRTSTGPTATTYAWTPAGGWTVLHPLHAPSARAGALLTDHDGHLLLADGTSTTTSSTACPSRAPSVSPDGNRVTIGCTATAGSGATRTPGDSWAWTGTDWKPTADTGLPPTGELLTSNPDSRNAVLVASTARNNTFSFADVHGTWTLGPGAHRWRLLSRTQPPGSTAAYDRRSHQLLTYSGNPSFVAGPGVGAPDRPGSSHTSVLTGKTWTALPVTAEQAGGTLVTDPLSGHVLLLTDLGHTFTWTGTRWDRQAASIPTHLLPAALISDPTAGVVMALFTDATLGDSTWSYNGTWTRTTRPTP